MNQDRILKLDGVHNFRDFGGYRMAGGGRLRRGLLWRSAEHGNASEADLEVIAGLGIGVLADLRGTSERTANPCRRPAGFAAEVLFFEGETASLALHIEAAGGAIDAARARAAMVQLYSEIAWRASLVPTIRRYLAALASHDGASLVHCVAGKDRTGFAVAIAQHALGVHRDDIMADYLLTNAANDLESRVAALIARTDGLGSLGRLDADSLRQLLGVQEAYLAAALAAVEARHGTLDSYLEDVLDVGPEAREAMRARLGEG